MVGVWQLKISIPRNIIEPNGYSMPMLAEQGLVLRTICMKRK